MKIHPYLDIDDKPEEAFRFYEKTLGGSRTASDGQPGRRVVASALVHGRTI